MVQLSLCKHPARCEVSFQWKPNWPALSLHLFFVDASLTMEKAEIELESRATCSLVANTQILRCKQGMLSTRLQTDTCETLLLDIAVPKAHQHGCSYVYMRAQCTYSRFSTHKFSRRAVTQRTSKIEKHTKMSKLGGGHLSRAICHTNHIKFVQLTPTLMTEGVGQQAPKHHRTKTNWLL